MYRCKHCFRPIEVAIEGELICPACYSQEDALPEQKEIAWLKSHCMDCDKPIPHGGGYCTTCQAKNEQAMITLKREHQGQTVFVHWRGPGWYVPRLSEFDKMLFYYHADHIPWSNPQLANDWPVLQVEDWNDFDASLDDHGVFVCCMSGDEREDYDVPRSVFSGVQVGTEKP